MYLIECSNRAPPDILPLVDTRSSNGKIKSSFDPGSSERGFHKSVLIEVPETI